MSSEKIEHSDKKKKTARTQHNRKSTSRERIIAKPLEDMSLEELEAIVGKKPKPPRSFNDWYLRRLYMIKFRFKFSVLKTFFIYQ